MCAEATSRSTWADPLAGTAQGWVRVRPTRCEESRVPARASVVLGGLGLEVDGPLLHGTVGEHHDQQRMQRREADELDGADGGGVVRGADDDGRVRGQLGEQARGALEHRLHLAVDLVEELRHLLRWTGPSTPGPVRWSTKKR